MAPITKWNARLGDPAITAEVVRKAFTTAESAKPGAAPRRRGFEPLLQIPLDGPLVAHLGPLRVGAGLAERPALA
jgi:hypothetical protein